MEDRIIKASEGKVFRRISDGFIFGKEIHLSDEPVREDI